MLRSLLNIIFGWDYPDKKKAEELTEDKSTELSIKNYKISVLVLFVISALS